MTAPAAADPHNLARFVDAQDGVYDQALAEIRAGHKRSRWMWFVFPQIDGLGSSAMSQRYAIRSEAEARAYLAHPLLGRRLTACAEAALSASDRAAIEVFGTPDDLKLQSCATLFAAVSPPGSVFDQLLDTYFQGQRDEATLQRLQGAGRS